MGQPPAAYGPFTDHYKYIYCITASLSQYHCRAADDCFRVSERYSDFSFEYDCEFRLYKKTFIGPGNPGQQRDCVDVQRDRQQRGDHPPRRGGEHPRFPEI